MRYKQLLFYAAKLKPIAPELRCDANRVPGCVSQVGRRCDEPSLC